MSQIIYEIINSPAFWFVAVIWLLICISWKSKRDPLLTRLADLISKPVVFEKDLHPDSYRFYSRLNMETLARVFKNALVLPFAGIIVQFRTWIQAQVDIVYRRDRPLRLLGYIIYLTFFVLFVWADAIAIVNTLATLDLLSGTVPDFLTQFDIAVAMGSLGAVIVAGLVMMDVHGDTSRFSDWEDHREGTFWKEFAKRATRIMLALAFIVVFTFGLQRLTIFQPAYTSSGLVKLFIDAVLLIVVPINTVLTTMLIAPEAFLGLFLLIILIQVILLGLVIVINYLVTLLAYIFPFMVDTIYRIVLLISDLLFYIILTPIELLIQLITAPFGGGRPGQG